VAGEFKVGRTTLFRDGQYAQALDRIAEVCGPELRTRVLCRGVKLGRGSVLLLAARSEQEMRRLAADLLGGKPVQRREPAGEVVRLTLPRCSPAAQAQAVLERLSRPEALQLGKALVLLAHRV